MNDDPFAMFNDNVVDFETKPKKRGRRAHKTLTEPWESSKEPVPYDDLSGMFNDAMTAKRFMQAGNATITLRSKKTQTRFTYRLRASEDNQCTFVALLNGPNNDADYKYLGRISRDIFWAGRKVPRPDDITKDAPSMKAFAWSWQKIVSGQMPDQLEIWHEGRCGRCGRKLTVPESVASGFGPECAGRMM